MNHQNWKWIIIWIVVGRDKLQSVALVGAPIDNSGQPGTNR